MFLDKLGLVNFRNFQRASVEFSDLTIIFGENAAGKTNLLEAIYLLSFGQSFRDVLEGEVINKDASFCRIVGEIRNDRRLRLELIFEKKDNKFSKITKINGIKRPSKSFFGKLSCVLFSPADLNLIYSSPSLRRRYFNLVSAQSEPEFRITLVKFQKVLQSRNKVLAKISEGRAGLEELEFWNKKFIDYASQIYLERRRIVNFFNQWIGVAYNTISGQKRELKINHQSSIRGKTLGEAQAYLKEMLPKIQDREVRFGFTLLGPQRDDFVFILDGWPVFSFASRGEARTVVLALKFIELKFLEENNIKPILLLDDVFSELDKARREFLCNLLKRQQTVVTTTDLDHIEKRYQQQATLFEVSNTRVARKKDNVL